MAVAMLAAIDYLLSHSCLHLLIHMAVCEPEKQTVGPGFVDKTKLPCYSLVVVRVMEATHMLHLITVNGSGAEIFYRRVYPVIVIGIVLEKIEPHI